MGGRGVSFPQVKLEGAAPCMPVCSVAQSCQTLGDPMDCSPPGSSVHGIFQARILKWVAIYSSRDLPHPGVKPHESPVLAGGLLTTATTWEAQLLNEGQNC